MFICQYVIYTLGIFYRDGRQVDRADLQRMVDILAHRGPDGAAVWQQTLLWRGGRAARYRASPMYSIAGEIAVEPLLVRRRFHS